MSRNTEKMDKKELLLRKYIQIYRPLLQKEAKKDIKRRVIVETSLDIAA